MSKQTLREIRDSLSSFPLEDNDKWRILERASGIPYSKLKVSLDETAGSFVARVSHEMAQRRAKGEPLQYVIGSWGFRQLDLFVDKRVLIPRPETEFVTQVAIDLITEIKRYQDSLSPKGSPKVSNHNSSATAASNRDSATTASDIGSSPALNNSIPQDLTEIIAVDLGTGSGAIGLSLAKEVDAVKVILTDLSSDSLDVARYNLSSIGSFAARRVEIRQGDWFDALDIELKGLLNMVVSNPPYLAYSEQPNLDPQVRDWEPHAALFSGHLGTESLIRLIDDAWDWLNINGWIVLEHAPNQADELATHATNLGFEFAHSRKDLTEKYRCFVARKPSVA